MSGKSNPLSFFASEQAGRAPSTPPPPPRPSSRSHDHLTAGGHHRAGSSSRSRSREGRAHLTIPDELPSSHRVRKQPRTKGLPPGPDIEIGPIHNAPEPERFPEAAADKADVASVVGAMVARPNLLHLDAITQRQAVLLLVDFALAAAVNGSSEEADWEDLAIPVRDTDRSVSAHRIVRFIHCLPAVVPARDGQDFPTTDDAMPVRQFCRYFDEHVHTYLKHKGNDPDWTTQLALKYPELAAPAPYAAFDFLRTRNKKIPEKSREVAKKIRDAATAARAQ
jgi:hypothetical protein